MSDANGNDEVGDKEVARKAMCFVLVGDDLYKRGFLSPLLRCVNDQEAEYVMTKLHNRVCSMHNDHQMLAIRVLRAG